MKFSKKNDIVMNLTAAGLTLFHEFAVIFATISFSVSVAKKSDPEHS